jgi:hypothetical protein
VPERGPWRSCLNVVFDATVTERGADLPGAAHLVMVDQVAYLDPASAVFEAMMDGWARQQRVRFLKAETIDRRVSLVRRVFRFTSLYPWQWTAAEVEAFIDSTRSGPRPIMVSTARGYLADLQMFLAYLTDGRYGWQAVCRQRFGEAPQQVLDEWNTVPHTGGIEGHRGGGRCPMTRCRRCSTRRMGGWRRSAAPDAREPLPLSGTRRC